jgi:IS1 family transposase
MLLSKLCCYGLGADAIADILQKDVRTIHAWLVCIGKKSNLFHDTMCLHLMMSLLFVQMDELWSFLGKKKRQMWVFAGLDVDSRFWINFQLGSRTNHNAKKLVIGIKSWLKASKDTVLKITTDKLAAYKNAIASVLEEVPHVYMQVVKRRKHKRLVTVKKEFVKGSEKDFTGKTQNTSYIERFNLTLRQRVSYLCRKTLGYCKKQSNLETVLWINLFDYNYRTFHKGLRVVLEKSSGTQRFKRKWLHRTPGMALGLTKQPLSWRFLFVAPIPLNH